MGEPFDEQREDRLREDAPQSPLGAGERVPDGSLKDEDPSFTFGLRQIVQTTVAVVLLIGGIYILFPKIVGVSGAFDRFGEASPGWLVAAGGFERSLAYAAYVALFRGVVGSLGMSTWHMSPTR